MLPGFFLNKLSSPPNVELPPHSCYAPAEQRLAEQLPKQGKERLQSNDVLKQRTCTLLEHLLYSHSPNPRLRRRVVAKAEHAYLTDAERATLPFTEAATRLSDRAGSGTRRDQEHDFCFKRNRASSTGQRLFAKPRV
jgi:hypothetical protein